VLLRDVIDLEATYAGPDAKAIQTPPPFGSEAASEAQAGVRDGMADATGEDPAPSRKSRSRTRAIRRRRGFRERPVACRHGGGDQAEGSGDLRPRRRQLQEAAQAAGRAVQEAMQSRRSRPAQEKRYKKLTDEIIVDVKSLSLNQARIESLVEQLYDINKRLISYDGKLMRLAESYGVDRMEFLSHYRGNELDPQWRSRVARLTTRGWKDFCANEKDEINELRGRSRRLPPRPACRSREYRDIVHKVQKGEREARQAKKEMVEANLAW
jgi:RNA polymerase primary sigma factor